VKVLQVIPSLAEAHGGPSRALTLMERALAAQGVAVETATTDDDGPGRRNGRPAGRPLAENGAVRRYFPKRLEFYKISPGFARWVWRHAGDYDIVHIHALFSFTSVAAAWAARRAGVPYVVRPLGTLGRYGMGRRRPWLKRLSLAWLEGPILRHAAAVHFTSEAERQEAEALGVPMRGALVPLGIEPGPAADVAAMQARFPALREGRCVLFLSRLDPKKNLEGLLRAFSLSDGALADARLLVAGDGAPAYVAGLKALSAELGLAGRVVWAGHLEGGLKASAFALAEVFALPSFSENFGIAAAEALMAGLPCLLGEGVAIAEEVASAGAGLAVAPDPESILRGLARLMEDGPARTEMAAAAAALARGRYSAQAMGEKLARLYADIGQKSGSGQPASQLPQEPAPMNPCADYAIVMTACIDPSSGPIKVARNDPAVRLQDYMDSLRFWLNLDDRRLSKIIFIENSGHPLEALRELARTANPLRKQVEFIPLCCNHYPEGVHYGYAELNMIDEAFAASKLLSESPYFIKATGRLSFPGVSRLLDRLGNDYLFAVDCRDNTLPMRSPQIFATTQLMVFSTLFYRRHLLNAKAELSKDLSHIETLLYRKLSRFKGRQGAVLRWPVNVDPVGHAAHWHKQYDSPRQRAISLARAACRMVFPNWWV